MHISSMNIASYRHRVIHIHITSLSKSQIEPIRLYPKTKKPIAFVILAIRPLLFSEIIDTFSPTDTHWLFFILRLLYGFLTLTRKESMKFFTHSYVSAEVHWGHRVALIEMVLKRWGHSLVVGSAGGASCCCLNLFILLTRINTARETIKKLITVLRNTP